MKKIILLLTTNIIFLFIYAKNPTSFLEVASRSTAQPCTIILINGTSGSGKTVTADLLEEQLGEQAGRIGCEEFIAETVIENACSQGFIVSPEDLQLATLEKWVTSHWSPAKINEVMTQARMKFDLQMKKLLNEKAYIIIDEAAITPKEIQLYEQYGSTLKVLLYCPINIMPYHILEYNNKNKLTPKSLKIALSQFLELYYPETLEHHTLAGCITPRDIYWTFISRDTRVFPYMSTSEIDTTMNMLQAAFKKHFNYQEQDIYLAPQLEHDLILNSGTLSSQECTRLIQVYLNKASSKKDPND